MASRSLKPCAHPGCRQLLNNGARFCETHQKQRQQLHDQQRGSSTARGYGYRWQKTSAGILKSRPLCECAECKQLAIPLPSQVVDHIKPHGGCMVLFWDPENWQALNKKCHDKKTAIENRFQSINHGARLQAGAMG